MKYKLFAILMACVFILSSCGGKITMSGKSDYPVMINDIEITSSPERVVSLSPSLTETIYMLGFGNKVVGVSDFCDRPAISNDVPNCGFSLSPYIEGIKKVNAQFVFTQNELPEKSRKELEQAGINVIIIPRANSFDDMLKNYEVISKVLSGLNRGQASDTQLKHYSSVIIKYINDSMMPYAKDKSAIYLRSMDFTIATGDTFEGKFISDMGFLNAAQGYTDWVFPADKESDLNPDVIFYATDIELEAIKNSPYYKNTKAVKNNLLIPIDPSVFERQSPMIFDYLLSATKQAFPEQFDQPMPSLVVPAPKQPEKELAWWEKIIAMFGNEK